MVNYVIALELLSITLIFMAIGFLLADDSAKEQKQMGYFMAQVLVQNVGYLLELTAPTVEAALVAVKIQYVGSVFIPLCYCWFIYIYSFEKIPYKLFKALAAIDFLLLINIFTFDRHTFYYRDLMWVESAEGHYYLSIEYGVFYPVFIFCCCIIPYFLSIRALCKAIRKKSAHVWNRKYREMIILSCFPLVTLILYATKVTYIFDLTPAALGIVLSLVVILLWRNRTYDFVGMAAEMVLKSMGDSVLVLDTRKRIISYNQAAKEVFTELESHEIGDPINMIKDFPQDLLDNEDDRCLGIHNRFYESIPRRSLTKIIKIEGM